MEELTWFYKTIDDLDNIEVKIENDDKTLLSLSSLPRSFEYFKIALLYGKKDIITLRIKPYINMETNLTL